MDVTRDLWLDPIPRDLRGEAVARLRSGDWHGLFLLTSNDYSLDLLAHNLPTFWASGLYEPALLYALTICRVNNAHASTQMLRWLCQFADRTRLRAAGDPLPGPGPFTLYRGVGGRGRARRVRGLSWTASLERAQWFADRAALFGLADPAVYVAVMPEPDVLAYVDDRQEQEFLVLPDPAMRVQRLVQSLP